MGLPSTVRALAVLGIGDPTIAGWIIAASYLAVAALCAWAVRVTQIGAKMAAVWTGPERRQRDRAAAYLASLLFWALLVMLFVFLSLNKQIDLQTWLTDVGRRIAKAQGWHDQRAAIQTFFVVAVATGSLVTLSVLLYLTRELLPRHVLAFVGLVLLVCFLLVRAGSFHGVDHVLAWRLLGIRMSWLLEFAGIFCVGQCAVKNCCWYVFPSADPREAPGGAR